MASATVQDRVAFVPAVADEESGDVWSGYRRPPAAGPIRVLVVESHGLLRSGLRTLLELESDIRVVAEAATLTDALAFSAALKPDLAIVDPSLPGTPGLELLRQLGLESPATRVLVLSTHDSVEHIRAAFDAGAVGYVRKFALRTDLLHAIRTAAGGAIAACPDVTDAMIRTWLAAGEPPPGAASHQLDEDERCVIRLIALGAPTRQIAVQLRRGVKVVEKYRVNLMRRLGLRNAAAVTQFAISSGLLAREELC